MRVKPERAAEPPAVPTRNGAVAERPGTAFLLPPEALQHWCVQVAIDQVREGVDDLGRATGARSVLPHHAWRQCPETAEANSSYGDFAARATSDDHFDQTLSSEMLQAEAARQVFEEHIEWIIGESEGLSRAFDRTR